MKTMVRLKSIVRVTLFVAFFLAVPFWACKGEELSSTRLITPDLKSEVDLTNDYNSILDYEETNICVEEDRSTFSCIKSQPVVKFLYISDRIVSFAENEDYFAITKNTRTYQGSVGQRTVRIYGSDAFIEVEGTWYETEFGYTTPEVWNKASTESLTYLDKWNPFKVYRVNAQETLYAGSGDGRIYSTNATWATARNGAAFNIDTTNVLYVNVDNATELWNSYFAFDTSSLDGEVSAATLNLTFRGVDDSDANNMDYAFLEGTATTTTALFTSNWLPVDYDVLSDYILGDDMAIDGNNSLQTWTLNAAGTSTIDVDGISAFELTSRAIIEDTEPAGQNVVDFFNSEQSGTNIDPYLEVTLQDTEEEEPATTTETTIGLEYPENMCINNDLSIICGMTQHYESTTTEPDWVEYHYFHIPWFVWVIITTVTLWIGNRLLIEFLIRWRQ